MKNKSLLIIVVVIIILGFVWWQKSQPVDTNTNTTTNVNTNNKLTNEQTSGDSDFKEFTMTSFYEVADNQSKTQFSVKEITVKKGDKVRIKVTNTRGDHDFKIDELNVYKETPLNQEVVIEFTAEKAGDFIYYCSRPNHRAWGQWGTLRVTE